MNDSLTGRSALIIGANGGIGSAIAHALGNAGARLVLAARDADRLDVLRADLETRGVSCRIIAADISDDDAVRRIVEAASADGMSIAINNAGTTHRPAPLGELPIEDIDRVLRVTLRGTFLAMRHQLALMPDGGCLVNVASTAGLAAAPGMAAYVAAKHAIVGLTRTAALDYADRGIRVNAVAPGPIDSGTLAHQPPEIKDRLSGYVPLHRLGQAEEVAAAVTWLASPEAGYVTGTVLAVDGGKSAGGA